MKPIKCLLGSHDWGKWVEVNFHIERTCGRCSERDARLPSFEYAIITSCRDIVLKWLDVKEKK